MFRVLQDVNLRQGPGNDFPRIGALARGAVVRVEGERLGWLDVRLADGGIGFVYKRWLTRHDRRTRRESRIHPEGRMIC